MKSLIFYWLFGMMVITVDGYSLKHWA